MAAYLLVKHAFLCLCGREVVLLDLRSDRYLAIDAARARALQGVVTGWPAYRAADADSLPSADQGARIAAAMLERGLLTTDCSLGKDAAVPSVLAATDTALDDASADAPVRLRHASAVLRAIARAAFNLRYRSMEWIVMDLQSCNAGRVRVADSQPINYLVSIFERVRSYLYTAQDACLKDSLALWYFLSSQGVRAQWVVGVRTSPGFMAHCWLQSGATVLNDSVEHVACYTPIMAV